MEESDAGVYACALMTQREKSLKFRVTVDGPRSMLFEYVRATAAPGAPDEVVTNLLTTRARSTAPLAAAELPEETEWPRVAWVEVSTH